MTDATPIAKLVDDLAEVIVRDAKRLNPRGDLTDVLILAHALVADLIAIVKQKASR